MSTEVTSYTVYPACYDAMVNSDKGHWTLIVRRVSRDRDLWMVEAGGFVLDAKGERDYPPLNSERTKAWEGLHWFTREKALALAEAQIDTLTWNWRTAQQASDQVAARLAAEGGA